MQTDARRDTPPAIATHFRPRPLPEPPRTRHVSRVGQPPRDLLGAILEQWLRDVAVSYTYPGE